MVLSCATVGAVEKMTDDNISYVDHETYRGGNEEYGFSFVVMEQVRRVVKLGSQELAEGYDTVMPGLNNTMVPYHQGATDEAFCNAVDVLEALIFPHFDTEEVELSKKFLSSARDLRTKCKEEAYAEKKDYKSVFIRNHIFSQWTKFYWLCTILSRLDYFASGSVEEII